MQVVNIQVPTIVQRQVTRAEFNLVRKTMLERNVVAAVKFLCDQYDYSLLDAKHLADAIASMSDAEVVCMPTLAAEVHPANTKAA